MGFIVGVGVIESGRYFAPKASANARVREEDSGRFRMCGMHSVGDEIGASLAKNSQGVTFFAGVQSLAAEGHLEE